MIPEEIENLKKIHADETIELYAQVKAANDEILRLKRSSRSVVRVRESGLYASAKPTCRALEGKTLSPSVSIDASPKRECQEPILIYDESRERGSTKKGYNSVNFSDDDLKARSKSREKEFNGNFREIPEQNYNPFVTKDNDRRKKGSVVNNFIDNY